MTPLVAERDELARFVQGCFIHAEPATFVSLRAFRDDVDGVWGYENWRTVTVGENGLGNVVDAAATLATLCAGADELVCFAAPIATFDNPNKADTTSLANGLVISAELDSNPAVGRRRLEEFLGPATIVLESGGLWFDPQTDESIAKLHLHWRLGRPTKTKIEHDFLREANKLVTGLAGGDPSAIPLVHPLRWPGSWHRKAAPRLARIVEYNPAVEITWQDALGRLRGAAETPGHAGGNDQDSSRQTLRGGMAQADLGDVAAALAVIPNDDSDIPVGSSWKQWTDTGLRTYAATGGSDGGLALFLEWSRQSAKSKEADTRAVWAGYRKSPPNRTGAGALFNQARAVWPGFVRPSQLRQRARLDASLAAFEASPQPSLDEPLSNNADGADPASFPVRIRVEGDAPAAGPQDANDHPLAGDGEEPLFPGGGELTEEEVERKRAAVKQASEKILQGLNQRYAVVNEAGKCIVVEWRRDPVLDRETLDRITFADIKRMYQNRSLQVLVKEGSEERIERRNLATWWLNHSGRRQYLAGVIFDPTNRASTQYMNLWRSFAVQPKPGDWGLMKDHIRRIICRGERDHADYVFNWLARLFQHPEGAGEVALVFRGKKGVGKSILGACVVDAFAQHGMHIIHASQLTGRFNAHLRDCCVLFADEAFFAGDRQHEGSLKGLITEHTLVIEGKYQNVVTVRNMLHLMLASNSDWVVPASIDERRFAVFDVLDTRIADHPYFHAMARQMENGGLAAMIHELLHRDITKFEVRHVPQTAALRAQKTLSLPSIERWWLAVLSRGFLCKSRHGTPWFTLWHGFYSTELLVRSYQQWCEENRPFDRKSREQLGRFFAETYQPFRPNGDHPLYEIDYLYSEGPLDDIAIIRGSRPHGYRVGPLVEARVRFTELYDVDAEWGHDPEE